MTCSMLIWLILFDSMSTFFFWEVVKHLLFPFLFLEVDNLDEFLEFLDRLIFELRLEEEQCES